MRKQLEKRLDLAWARAVKNRAGFKCEYCGKMSTLNAHHIYSRAKKSVRWDVDNGICLCVAHHVGTQFSAHKTPVPFGLWLTKKRGQKKMNLLNAKANQIGKYAEFELKIKLKELNKLARTK